MTNPCPICNFKLHRHEESQKDKYVEVHCHDCGEYKMDKDLAANFRRKFLSFDMSSVGGRELYDSNIRSIRRFLARHHRDVISEAMISQIIGLYRPRQ
ncbi:hypothetical protein [Candidatus Odyssella thessalonicensis]|uniref:hypothetical protein n=1 Tax=Candidatus Odyssella thessalonicensis TaxID=84647 RepID=UPI000225BC61|nr:hypothetical protein [Candidatus Odyssella thessalonicensis]